MIDFIFIFFANNTAVENAIIFIGFVIGFFVTLFSWKGDNKGKTFSDDDRRNAIIWGALGLFTTLFGDWNGFSQLMSQENANGNNLPVSRLDILLLYICTYLLSILLVLFSTAILVIVGTISQNRNSNRAIRSNIVSHLLDYLFYGYGYYKEQTDQQKRFQTLVTNFKDLNRNRHASIASIIQEIERFLRTPSQQQQQLLVRSILKQICTVSTYFLKDPQNKDTFYINANYMIAQSYPENGMEHGLNILFEEDDKALYDKILVLQEYAEPGGSAPGNFVLPVVKKDQKYQQYILPGAPEAYLSKDVIIDGVNVEFAPGVSYNIREEVKNYLGNQRFNYFVSFKIPVSSNDNSPIGVVNIETNHDMIFQKEDDFRTDFLDSILPFNAAIGLVLLQNPDNIEYVEKKKNYLGN
ncbi:MAG: hypothetical protein OEZ58_18225 [Gammaproteobacteria bacterium]|nr:hypothetical protein [Gammaproteobacteria bacterium]